MEASGWHNGHGAYGIRVGKKNRDAFFRPSPLPISIEIDGRVHRFFLSPSFWRDCPEIRDRKSPVLQEWLNENFGLPWNPYNPPKVILDDLGNRTYRLRI